MYIKKQQYSILANLLDLNNYSNRSTVTARGLVVESEVSDGQDV